MPEGLHWDRVLFSAKESTYKAWFPLTAEWLGFHETSVKLRRDGTFTSHLLVPGPTVGGRRIDRFAGHWMIEQDLVLTAIAIPVLYARANRK